MPIDFKQDLKEFVLSQLDYYEVKYKKNDDLLTLLIKYFTFSAKYIVPQRRSVDISIELSKKMVLLPVDTQKALIKLHFSTNSLWRKLWRMWKTPVDKAVGKVDNFTLCKLTVMVNWRSSL